MAYSYSQYIGDGTTTLFSVTFPYLSQSNVTVTVGGVAAAYTWASSTQINITSAPALSAIVLIQRTTQVSTPTTVFTDGSVIAAADLNSEALQLLYLAQEALDKVSVNLSFPSNDASSGVLPAAALRANDSSGNPIVISPSAGSTTVNATLVTPTISGNIQGNFSSTGTLAMGSSFLRNRLINGSMLIAQRATSFATIASGGTYTLDRWLVGWSGAAITVQQSGGVPPGSDLSLTVVGAASNVGVTVSQRIESVNCPDLVSGSYVTVSGWFYQSSGGAITPYVQLYAPTAVDNYSGVVSISSAVFLGALPSSTWTYLTATILLTGSGANGVQLSIGSNAAILATKVFALTNVQLEVGTVATPFERRMVGHELALCQRYYESISTFSGAAYASGGGQAFPYYVRYAVVKRATPSVTAPMTTSNCATAIVNGNVDQFAIQATSSATGSLSFYNSSSVFSSVEIF